MQDSRFFRKEPAIFFIHSIVSDIKTIDDRRKFSINKGTC